MKLIKDKIWETIQQKIRLQIPDVRELTELEDMSDLPVNRVSNDR